MFEIQVTTKSVKVEYKEELYDLFIREDGIQIKNLSYLNNFISINKDDPIILSLEEKLHRSSEANKDKVFAIMLLSEIERKYPKKFKCLV